LEFNYAGQDRQARLSFDAASSGGSSTPPARGFSGVADDLNPYGVKG